MVSEKNVIQDIEILSNLKDLSLIKNDLNRIQNIFNNETIRKKFNTLKVDIQKTNDVNDARILLKRFIDEYGKEILKETKGKTKELLNEAAELLKQRTILTRRNELLRLFMHHVK